MKRIANFLVTVTLVCIVLLLQVVQAQGRGLCINSAAASQTSMTEATANDDILDGILNFGLGASNASGGPLPGFPPFSAFGSIQFFAASTQDVTFKEGFVFLTVFGRPDIGLGFGGGPIPGPGPQPGDVPVTGEFTTTNIHARADGTTSTQSTTELFFRDRQGRIRQERGDLVAITDPVAGVRYVLNTKNMTAHRMMMKKADRAAPPATSGPNLSSLSERRSLGTQRVDGVEAAGKEYTSVIPAGSKLGNHDEPDAKLFAVPEGYRVVDAVPVTKRGLQ